MIISRKKLTVIIGTILSMVACFFYSDGASADDGTSAYSGAPGARAAFGGQNNEELFLGGNYIELGISRWGDFGTVGKKPVNFRGSLSSQQIGMSVDYDGFGSGSDLPLDFYLPGDPEERFAVGYKTGANTYTASNSALRGDYQMQTTVTDESDVGKGLLQAEVESTWINRMKITQVISFGVNDKFYRNEVTLTNLTDQYLDSARYMRNIDPDNTQMLTGYFDTQNTVTGTAAEDGKAVVKAETYSNSDPIYKKFGTRAPLFLYSNDPAAKASTFGFVNKNPYAPEAYDFPRQKGKPLRYDAAITLTWESGGLAPGESKSFIYYTSLEDRDFKEIVKYPIIYSVVAVDGAENGTLTGSVENTTIHSNDEVAEDKTVVFTATPEDGYRVKEWRQNGTVVTVDGEILTENDFIISSLTGPENITVEFEAIDATPPVTIDDAPAGWQNKDVTINLSASDAGSGVEATYYQVNGGEQMTGTSAVLTEEGTHTVTYWSVDHAGNVEAMKNVNVQIDKSTPVTIDDAPTGWQNKDVTIHLNASDEGSGVAATYYQVNGGEQMTGTSAVLTEEGTHTVTYWSVDHAGNVEAMKNVNVQIDKQAPILKVIPNTTTLWPANNKMVDITIELDADGGVSGIDSIVLVSITSNENLSETDIQGTEYGTADTSFKLRAKRDGKGQGRIYTITYKAIDQAGNTTVSSITIEVPHDQSNKK